MPKQPENLLNTLAPEGVDGYELLGLLQRHYGSAGVDRRVKDSLVYPSALDYSLRIRWKNGRVTQVEPGPELKRDDLTLLRDMIRSRLVESSGTKVVTSQLLAGRPVSGYFRGSRLQILPASLPAPKSTEFGADHPFHLQSCIRWSVDQNVSMERFRRATFERAWTLNALLRSRVRALGPRNRKFWALCQSDVESGSWEIKWASESYHDPGLSVFIHDEFRAAEDVAQIPVIAHDEYYNADGVPGPAGFDGLVLPDSLSEMIDTVDGLEHADRGRFIRAARWMTAARDTWEDHISSWYIASVSAIETLLSEIKPNHCKECGQVVGVTNRFEQFVEHYAPRAESDAVARKELYAIRSQLAHGNLTFDIDEAPWAFMTHLPKSLEQGEAFDAISRLVKRVIVGWLRSKTG